jgi:hypothetical protein
MTASAIDDAIERAVANHVDDVIGGEPSVAVYYDVGRKQL